MVSTIPLLKKAHTANSTNKATLKQYPASQVPGVTIVNADMSTRVHTSKRQRPQLQHKRIFITPNKCEKGAVDNILAEK
jgi:hypothetical protein